MTTPDDGPSILEQNIARFEAAAVELRAVIRAAHTATKEARDAARDLRAAISEAVDERERLAEAVQAACNENIEARLQAAVDEAIDTLGAETQRATKNAQDRVIKVFRQLENTLLTGQTDGRGLHLADAIKGPGPRVRP